jgi:hypothetical protein
MERKRETGERMQSHEAPRGWMGVPIAHLTSCQLPDLPELVRNALS